MLQTACYSYPPGPGPLACHWARSYADKLIGSLIMKQTVCVTQWPMAMLAADKGISIKAESVATAHIDCEYIIKILYLGRVLFTYLQKHFWKNLCKTVSTACVSLSTWGYPLAQSP